MYYSKRLHRLRLTFYIIIRVDGFLEDGTRLRRPYGGVNPRVLEIGCQLRQPRVIETSDRRPHLGKRLYDMFSRQKCQCHQTSETTPRESCYIILYDTVYLF